MTQTVFDPEQHAGPGWASFLAQGALMRQQEAERLAAERAAEEARRKAEDVRLEQDRSYFDQLAAKAMNVDLSLPWTLGFMRWINVRYGQIDWPKLQVGTEAYKYEVRLYLRAETARKSGNYATYTTLFNKPKYRFSEPRAARQRRDQPSGDSESFAHPQQQVVGA